MKGKYQTDALLFERACDDAAYAAFARFEKDMDLPDGDDARSEVLTDLNMAITAVMQDWLHRHGGGND